MDKDEIAAKVAAFVVLLVVGFVVWLVISLVLAIPVMLLWNWLCPTLFGLPGVSLFQAWGLSFLSALLFKNQSFSSSKKDE